MPGFEVRHLHVQVGGHTYHLRVLRDRQQFADPDGRGAELGISCAQWSHFGKLWPAGRRLAQAMDEFDIEGKDILEIGCGIGLPSLVLQRRGARVVASDIHPQVEPFLAYNAALNDLPAVPFRHLDWTAPSPNLGLFDVLIASDVLYERDHARLLAGVVERHAAASAEIVITDPGRGSRGTFTRLLEDMGFSLQPWVDGTADVVTEGTPIVRVLHLTRGEVRRAA